MKLVNFVMCLVVGLGVLVFSACGPSQTIARVDTGAQIDLSGDWNDTDSQLVAQQMIEQALNERWLTNFSQKHNGAEPKVIVGSVINQAQEHINTQTFVLNLQRALINSGRVLFIQSGQQRAAVRAERAEQAENAQDAKRQNYETASDFMLTGTINTIFDQEGGKQVKFYQVNLELTDMESNVIVWTGEKQIKKYITKRKLKA
ncbi:MAG: penicillin-binding protein activator LpoB [Elusimicrobiota bacterium]|nr:penicillin-binding protein activator LpoB [Elusimicrobiota bacterium]